METSIKCITQAPGYFLCACAAARRQRRLAPCKKKTKHVIMYNAHYNTALQVNCTQSKRPRSEYWDAASPQQGGRASR